MDFDTFLLTIVPVMLGIAFAWFIHLFQYWATQNVPHEKPSIPMGNMGGVGRKIHFVDLFQRLYQKFKASTPAVGMYLTVAPVLLVLDLELAKNVLVRDFSSFQDRGMYVNERDDPLSAHLFSIHAERWRVLRTKLSPTFTSGKIKSMFLTIREIGDEFVRSFDRYVDSGEPIDIKKLCQCFTCDVIGFCAFGIQCNSLRDGDSTLLEMSNRVFNPSRWSNVRASFLMSFQRFSRMLGLRLLPKDISDYFLEMVRTTVEGREQSPVQRPDFLNLLIQLKNRGFVDDEASESTEKLTLNEISAQAFVFFFGGFETSASAQSLALFLLASHPEHQEKVREEIFEKLKLHGNEITYDALKEMTYLDQVINETMRMYPPIPHLMRVATTPYRIDSMDITLEKGTMLTIPVYCYHHDPEIFPEPERFNPDRFAPAEVQKRHSHAFLPFGDGPRNCIGMRFGLLEVKFGIVQLLSKLRFTVSDRMIMPLQYSKTANMLEAEGGLWLNATKL